jgi:hypothetical protein
MKKGGIWKMRFETFEKNMKNLAEWFGRKLKEKQLEIWFERVSFMPDEAFDEIVDTIIDRMRTFPTPQQVKDLWLDWRRAHPEKLTTRHERSFCSECSGKGYIEVWYRSEKLRYVVVDGQARPIWYSKLLPCAKCENWKSFFGGGGKSRPNRLWTKSEIEAAGMALEQPDLKRYSNMIAEKDLDTLIAMSVKDASRIKP